jgi:large subunit ribosomal protein L1
MEPEKKLKCLLLQKVQKQKKHLDAGADFAGFEEYLEKIKGGWADVDVIVATPDSMGELGKLGKI